MRPSLWHAAVLLLASGCYDFDQAQATCLQSGPCRPAGSGGGGTGGSGGGTTPGGGPGGGSASSGGGTASSGGGTTVSSGGGTAGSGGGIGGGGPDAGPPPPLDTLGPCSADRLTCWDQPATGEAYINAAWTNGTEVWLAGDYGLLMRFDGTRWRQVTPLITNADNLDTFRSFQSIVPVKEGMLLGGGQCRLTLVPADGGTDAGPTSTTIPGCVGELRFAANDGGVYAISSQGTLYKGQSPMLFTQETTSPAQLISIDADDEHGVFVGSNAGVVSRYTPGSGLTSVFNRATSRAITAMKVTRTGEFWFADYPSPGHVLRAPLDGGLPVEVTMPTASYTGPTQAIGLSPSGDLFIADEYAGVARCLPDGTCQHVLDTTNRHLGTLAVSADGGGHDVVAAGTGFVSWRETGNFSWQPLVPARAPITDIAELGDGGLIAVGFDDLVMLRNADGWTATSESPPGSGSQNFNSVAVLNGGQDVWVAGGSSPTLGRLQPGLGASVVPAVIQAQDGGALGASESQRRVAKLRTAGPLALAVGDRGLVRRWAGGQLWVSISGIPTTVDVRDAMLLPDGGAVLVGSGSAYWQLSGDTLKPLTLTNPPPVTLSTVAGTSENRFWVAGGVSSDCQVWLCTAGTCQQEPQPTGAPTCRDLLVRGPDDVWVAGDDGYVARRVLNNWIREPTYAAGGVNFTSVRELQRRLYFVGDLGAVLVKSIP